jgi:hypothetical protein
LVANLAAIPSTPSNDTYIELQNSTGLESFTPLAGKPAGFVGDPGLSVRLRYTSAGSTWNWLNYYANNSETRYLQLAGGTLTGKLTLDGAPSSNLHASTKKYVDDTATTLQGNITTAQSTANTAQTAANAAQSTANAAQSSASAAQTAASAAQSTANAAQTAANAAQSTANTASSTASAALPKAGGTMTGNITFNGTQTFPGVVTGISGTSPVVITGTTTPTVSVNAGTTAGAGIVQLTDSVSSTSTTTAATPAAVKSAYDLASSANTTANAALPKAGGTMTGAVTFTSTQSYPKVPQNSKTASYTLIATDAGKHVSITTGGVTIPASILAVGDIVSIYNNSASTQTITQGASVTLRQAGTANTGNRTLDQYGIATVLCVASNTFVITGPGVA